MAKFKKSKEPPKVLRSITHVLTFGKHKGKTIQEVMKCEPNWIHWALENVPDFRLNRNALLLLPPYRESEDWEDREWGDFHDMH
jgi:hypothetical protein